MKRIIKWKKWAVVIPVLMAAIILALTPAAVMADNEATTVTDSTTSMPDGLAIVAPVAARVGQEISMTVFLRSNQEPFPGAGVWAFTREQAEIMRQEMNAASADGTVTASAEAKDYEALANIHGTFLGRTDERGKLYHAFSEKSTYVLGAFQRGLVPGFTHIRIGETPRALAIRAPQSAKVGEEVTMTVYQRGTEQPVGEAGIWAITRDNAEALKQDMAILREDTSTAAEDKDYESLVSIHGTFLGWTDDNGNLSHTFEEEGGYLLVAVKRGYIPGHAAIRIGETIKALGIRAPYKALVGEEVTMTVFQRGTAEAVEGAGVWAISPDKFEIMRQEMAALRENADVAAAETDYESLANIYGTLLGRTDENGNLSHTFEEEGGYLLVAVKRGYIPGFAPIRIITRPDTDALRSDGVSDNSTDNALSLQSLSSVYQRAKRYTGRISSVSTQIY
ncbi:hypothetical protein ACFLW0_01130 [Chloroflexota bacterium]